MDCRASVTITGSLLNCEYVDVKITKIETAKEAESILASHTCRKMHSVRNTDLENLSQSLHGRSS